MPVNMQQKKYIILEIFFLLGLIVFSSFVLGAENSGTYKIQGDVINFTIPPSQEGIYSLGYIYQGEIKINYISLCKDIRCYGKTTASYNITPELIGEYNLMYYNYDTYSWKNISFNLNGEVILDNLKKQNSQNINNNPNSNNSNSINNNGASLTKITMVTTICKLQHLFNSQAYQDCKNEYLG